MKDFLKYVAATVVGIIAFLIVMGVFGMMSIIAFTVFVLALAIVSEGAIGFLQAWWLIILVYVLTSLFLFLKKKK